MKHYIYLILALCILSCDSESANDCFQESGNSIQEEFIVSDFEKILVNRNVELILKEGPDIQVIIETGENLLNDIDVKVVNNELQLTDNNICNYVRDYASTKVYVTAPNITHIRSSTQFDISSDGVLNYDSLRLLSEDFSASGTFTVGDFKLVVNTQNLRITSNNISSYYISGETEDLFVGFYSGTGRFQGENLIAQNVDIYHRASNDMVVHPQLSLTGELRGTGNLISLNVPPTVEVEELYTGRLIFR
ncbi:head GIN domain-containing protein [Lacinutrix iliipiscaria]|uniref:Head GIN domain-containing protein n=1 Tax=Lacinutrix iliipiscaria TaxID=1230532 RepID=A0ABW5WLS2_9FLAO